MSSNQISKSSSSSSQVQNAQSQRAHDTEVQEHHNRASASVRFVSSKFHNVLFYVPSCHNAEFKAANHSTTKAGLNLNIFGALSGAFSFKSKKTTHTNADGSSEVVEEGEGRGKSHLTFTSSALA
jgi:hypothetical protein